MSSSTTRIRCTERASLGRRGGGNCASAPRVFLRGRRGSRWGVATAAVLVVVPLTSTLLEVPPALVVPRTGSAVMPLPPSRPEDPSDQEEDPDQEEREQEEPGEPVAIFTDHVDHLDLLAVGLGAL